MHADHWAARVLLILGGVVGLFLSRTLYDKQMLQAIRAAAAALAAGGRGGTLLFPAGRTYLTGAFNLSSNSVLKLEAHSA